MRLGVVALVLLGLVSSSRADDVSDAVAEAAKAYAAGDLATAKQSLDLASQLVAQKQADALAKLLPEPPSGWTAEPVDATAGMAGFLGGGLILKRSYERGEKAVELQLMANSPILGSMAPLFANVQLLGGMGKVFRQKGRVAVLTNEGEIQLVVGKTFVTLTGSGAEADKRAILDLIDLDAIDAFGK